MLASPHLTITIQNKSPTLQPNNNLNSKTLLKWAYTGSKSVRPSENSPPSPNPFSTTTSTTAVADLPGVLFGPQLLPMALLVYKTPLLSAPNYTPISTPGYHRPFIIFVHNNPTPFPIPFPGTLEASRKGDIGPILKFSYTPFCFLDSLSDCLFVRGGKVTILKI